MAIKNVITDKLFKRAYYIYKDHKILLYFVFCGYTII